MMMIRSVPFALISVLCASLTANAAIISLYIPGESPAQAITADPIGTDGQGHTTWRVGPGVPSGTFTQSILAPSATLVLGPSDAHVDQDANGPGNLKADCKIDNGQSVCTIVVNDPLTGNTITETVTERATPIAVQVAETAAGAQPTGGSPTGSSPQPANPEKTNGAASSRAMAVTVLGGLGAVFAVASFL